MNAPGPTPSALSAVDLILKNLPCSVELPAGTGKTETITMLVSKLAAEGKRALVLTHTHAGVDALRRRLKKYKVPGRLVSVRTLDSWCFNIIANFPTLSNIEVSTEPDWTLHEEYHQAGARAVPFTAIRRMLQLSYDVLVVDEYQDCQLHQHELVKAISRSVPTCVFGDRMQGLFFWSNSSVIWERDVVTSFPAVSVPVTPWRWLNRNPELGNWLLLAREDLMHGRQIDLRGTPITWVPTARQNDVCHIQPRHPATTVAISRWPKSAAILAQQLGGAYTMIEELEGKHLREFATIVDTGRGPQIAEACVNYAVSCSFGVADKFPVSVRRALSAGKKLQFSDDDALNVAIEAVNQVFAHGTPSSVLRALLAIRQLQNVRLFRREAWNGILDSLRLVVVDHELTVLDAVVQVRNKISVIGRRPESRIVGRPLLIKGLEFDHAVVTESNGYNAHELYVALTRGSKSVAVVSETPLFSPVRPYSAEAL